jgi:L-seryl-tRNA(Ser) seleniumtransferase
MMLVHTSNYLVVGFTQQVQLAELVQLGRQRGVPVIDDIGSGAVIDFQQFGLAGEPVASASIRAGADIVLFSGDKLLGGPQCGIIVGRRELIERIVRHPLMRALRVDKLTLAALAATLRLYRHPDKARREVPLLQLLETSPDNLKNRAERLAPQLAACSIIRHAEAVSDVAFLGGGSLPTQQLPTWCIGLTPADGWSVDRLARALRTGQPAVVGRVQQERLLLDLRSVFPRQDQQLVTAITTLSTKPPSTVPA